MGGKNSKENNSRDGGLQKDDQVQSISPTGDAHVRDTVHHDGDITHDGDENGDFSENKGDDDDNDVIFTKDASLEKKNEKDNPSPEGGGEVEEILKDNEKPMEDEPKAVDDTPPASTSPTSSPPFESASNVENPGLEVSEKQRSEKKEDDPEDSESSEDSDSDDSSCSSPTSISPSHSPPHETPLLSSAEKTSNTTPPSDSPSFSPSKVGDGNLKSSSSSSFSLFSLLLLLPFLLILGVFLAFSFPGGSPNIHWESMPPLVRNHYSKGQTLKVFSEGMSFKVFVQSIGPATGETVLFVHGIGGSSFLYREILPLLAKGNMRGVAIDLPGSGLSDKPLNPEIYNFQQLANVINQIIDSLQLPPIHLVLHDSSGIQGIQWAVNNVNKLRSLTFIDTSMELPFSPAFPSFLLNFPSFANLALYSPFSSKLIFQYCCSRRITSQIAESHSYLLRNSKGIEALAMSIKQVNRSQGFQDDLYHNAAGILGQTDRQLVWANSWSQEWREEGEEVLTRWPLAELHSHGGARWPQEDVPDDIARRILSFVGSLPPTRWSPPKEEIPEHIQRQFDAMRGHGHGGHSHGPGCSHSH